MLQSQWNTSSCVILFSAELDFQNDNLVYVYLCDKVVLN